MSWVEVHQSLKDHRKLLTLSGLLHIKPVTTLGHLVSLWLWCLDNAPDGNLGGIPENTVAKAAQYDKNCHTFVKSLEDSGFLDKTTNGLLIHDWQEYVGKLLSRREANRARQKAFRDTHVTVMTPLDTEDVAVASLARNGATEPNRTVPYLTVPSSSAECTKTFQDCIKGYADNIGALTPIIAEKIGFDVEEYGANWFYDALVNAVSKEKRSLGYIEGTLKGWKREGRGNNNGHKSITAEPIRSESHAGIPHSVDGDENS